MLKTYTVSQANSAVLARLGDTSFSSTTLLQFANDVNREVCNAVEWPFMERSFTGTAASGNVFFDLQTTITNFQLPIALQLNAPDASAVAVRYWPHERFYREYPDPTGLASARPSMWSMFGTTLIIGPRPLDQTYTFQLLYLAEPTTLTGNDSVFDIPNAFSEVAVLGMLSRAQMVNDQYDLAQVTAQEYDIKLDKMIKRLTNRSAETIENNWRGVERDIYDEYYS
jgi:hypothetical protein